MQVISAGIAVSSLSLLFWRGRKLGRREREVLADRRYGPPWAGLLRGATYFRDLLWIVTFLLIITVAVSPSVILGNTLTIKFPLDSYVQGIGLLLWLAGVSLMLWASTAIREYATEQILISKNQPLIQTGPYAKTRHPIYGGALVIGLGLFLFYLNLLFLLFAVTRFIVDVYRAREEEKLLTSPEGFGQQYVEYRKRTRMFIPYVL